MSHYNFVVCYRNRPDSLKVFLEEFPKAISQRDYVASFNIIIAEQIEGKPFNLGKLLNCGFDYFKNGMKNYSYSPWDVFCFHPVDQLPINGPDYWTDYKYDDIGFTWLCEKKYHAGYPKAFLGQNVYYEKINGLHNCLYGWGGDDEFMGYAAEFTETNYLIRQVNFRENESSVPSDRTISAATHEIIEEFKIHKNTRVSGLSTLQYTKLNETWLADNIVRILVKI